MLKVGLLRQSRKNIAPESNQFSFREFNTGETRELLDESILIKANVRIPSDIRRINVTKGNIMKSI